MQKLNLRDLPLKGKKVLMRVDFNVPMDSHGHITDDSRIKASLPSIQYALDQGCSLILMSHLGRPKNKEFTLKPCADHLASLLHKPVIFAPESSEKKLAADLKPGEILMLENLRFHPGEENPEAHPEFVKALAELGDYYVNDAFGTAHRNHASTCAIAKYFSGKAAAGFLLEKEIEFLGKMLNHPERPFVGIIGGAKISTKIGALPSLLKKMDVILIGGAMAHTFLKAKKISVGSSLYEEEFVYQAHFLMNESKRLNKSLLLPIDLVITNQAEIKVIDVDEGIPEGWQGVDIGPKTIQMFKNALISAKTVLWNGPLGIFEVEAFATGTKAIAEALADLHATTIVGGGDSLAAIYAAGVADKITHLSTGGGASLEYIEFGTLPGIEALSHSNRSIS